ncbi:MAG TPA: hypothetical protein PKI19_08125 [Elusimicrobiales bacterium]|nr:hypothetical protein [Elusimicrobiales bacterium]
MKSLPLSNLAAALVALCLWARPASAASDGSAAYSGLAARVAAYARTGNIQKIVVADFAARGGASSAAAEYVSEKISAALVNGAGPALVEREYIKKIMREVRASTAAAGAAYREKLAGELGSVDAVVTGSVFAAGDEVRIMLRLVDAKKGTVLFSAEATAQSAWQEAGAAAAAAPRAGGGIYQLTAELPGILVPVVPAGWTAEAPSARPADLRDALSDSSGNSCAARRQRLAGRNAALVDAKARYWALKMKAPGWSGPGLRENPGSEIEAPEVQARFYKLLAGYYKSELPARLEAGELAKVTGLLEAEELFSGECAGQ